MARKTTIKLDEETKKRLDHLKEHERESYDEILQKILYILNLNRKNPMLSFKALNNIDKSIKRRAGYTKVNYSNLAEDLEEDSENKQKSESKNKNNKSSRKN